MWHPLFLYIKIAARQLDQNHANSEREQNSSSFTWKKLKIYSNKLKLKDTKYIVKLTWDSLPTWLLVPTSRVMGRHWWGLMPAKAVYRANLPTGIPIPHAPKSPRPRILSPSVTTIARTSGSGLNSTNKQPSPFSPYSHQGNSGHLLPTKSQSILSIQVQSIKIFPKIVFYSFRIFLNCVSFFSIKKNSIRKYEKKVK